MIYHATQDHDRPTLILLNDISRNIRPRTDTPKNRQNPQATAPQQMKAGKFGKADPTTLQKSNQKRYPKRKNKQKLLQNIST